MALCAPSLLAADFLHLDAAVEIVNRYADIFHIDVMDGVFVPNISFGFPVVDAVAKKATKPMDVHLMIVHPEKYIPRFAKAGAGMISFHEEEAEKEGNDPGEILDLIHAEGAKAGLAINPDIAVEKLFPYLKKADYVLVMSVFAGFGGQKFIPETIDRIRAIRAEMDRQDAHPLIEIDGGVNVSNAGEIVKAGADILVAGSAVFKSDDPESTIRLIKGCN